MATPLIALAVLILIFAPFSLSKTTGKFQNVKPNKLLKLITFEDGDAEGFDGLGRYFLGDVLNVNISAHFRHVTLRYVWGVDKGNIESRVRCCRNTVCPLPRLF